MKSISNKRRHLIRNIIMVIEREFKGSIAVWRCTGTPSDDYTDDTEVFELYNINEEEYESIVKFEWKLRDEFARPYGFTIQVQEFTEEETAVYRAKEIARELERRKNNFAHKQHLILDAVFVRNISNSNVVVGGYITKKSNKETVSKKENPTTAPAHNGYQHRANKNNGYKPSTKGSNLVNLRADKVAEAA